MKNKDRLYMDIAKRFAKQSYCKRSKVGAIIEKDGRILVTGYNGTLSGDNNNCEDGDVTKDAVVHAEQNIISFAAKYGISLKNTTMYITLSPCIMCAKLIVQSGIRKVIYKEKYRDTSGIKLLQNHNIICIKYKE